MNSKQCRAEDVSFGGEFAFLQRFLAPSEEQDGVLPFACVTASGEPGFNASMTAAYRDRDSGMRLHAARREGNAARLTYRAEGGLCAEVTIERVCPGAYRQRVRVINEGERPVKLTVLANSVCFSEYGAGLPQERYRLSYCVQTWYGEGQWRRCMPQEAGLFDEGGPPPTSSFGLCGISSQTTSKYFPNVYWEDLQEKKCWFCELEPVGKWHMSFGLRRKWWEKSGTVILSCGCAEDRWLNFVHELRPGEDYTSADCLFGVADGGIDEALRIQTEARRLSRRRQPEQPSVVFNDYMNCLWADPDEETCLRLASFAKRAGADVYVMDSGWFADRGINWTDGLGGWETDSDRFPSGLCKFISRLKEMGLVPGLWFELEVCSEKLAEQMPPDWFVCTGGERYGSKVRRFFDFTNPQVRSYLSAKVEKLLRAGIRFIKNDYNDSYYAFGEEGAYNLQQNQRAFYDFVEELYGRYPDLIIENCASGAMRSDGGAMRHFAMQSFSDQDDYRLYPSIVKGSLRNILPEQLGIWCMPHPVHCSGRDLNTRTRPQDLIAYNFVSALAGVPYLSGRLDLCSEEELDLIAQGVALAKQLYGFVRRSYPQFPQGMSNISARDWDSMILSDGSGKEKLLFVWRLEGGPCRSFPLKAEASLCQLFPPAPAAVQRQGGRVAITLENCYSAALFRITEP